MMTNDEIADLLQLSAKLMDLHSDNAFKSRSYGNAGFQINKYPTELSTLDDTAIAAIPGVGKSMIAGIRGILNTGKFPPLEELLARTPKGVLEMMRIKGLGPKKVKAIWDNLQIESPGELLYACLENRLKDLKGFGDKTQEEVIKSIQFLQANNGRFFYADGFEAAELILNWLNEFYPSAQISSTGELRRKSIELAELEFLIDEVIQPELELLEALPDLELEEVTDDYLKGTLLGRFPVTIHFCQSDEFVKQHFKSSAAPVHLNSLAVDWSQPYSNEASIYQSIGCQYVIPEMREYKIQEMSVVAESELIALSDIKGVIHTHTLYSDGRNSILEMANHSKSLGYSYLVISDHSKSAVYAKGLQEERIFQQHAEIEQLNNHFEDFKIYKSIESDILGNGDLDYDASILKLFDCVIASVHSNLNMSEENAMKRLLKAIENPYTTILGHPTGRLLLSRPGYPLNHEKLIDACAANKVCIELNASPYRLDIDWKWIPYAIKRGVLIAINPDAHSLAGISDINWGVEAARKGGLKKSDCLNTFSSKAFEEYLKINKK